MVRDIHWGWVQQAYVNIYGPELDAQVWTVFAGQEVTSILRQKTPRLCLRSTCRALLLEKRHDWGSVQTVESLHCSHAKDKNKNIKWRRWEEPGKCNVTNTSGGEGFQRTWEVPGENAPDLSPGFHQGIQRETQLRAFLKKRPALWEVGTWIMLSTTPCISVLRESVNNMMLCPEQRLKYNFIKMKWPSWQKALVANWAFLDSKSQ